ncbi:MAG TPA: ADOP family duplicated permease [Thermoanaerobaculia bacterium]|jgi:predicted permease
MSGLARDIRIALRSMARRPLVSAAIVATLALGIGANAAIFRVYSAVFLRPLPFGEEDRLVRIFTTPKTGGSRISPRTGLFLGVEDHAASFESLAAQRFMDMTLSTAGGPERVTGIAVSSGWARTLRVSPMLGRVFLPEEERAGIAAPAVLMSHATWKARFGGDPGILGHVVRLDGRAREVIGVMPPGLRYPYEADFWVPMTMEDDRAATWGLNIQARLRPGVSLAEANDELSRLADTLPAAREIPGTTILAVPIRQVLIDDDGPLVAALFCAVGFLTLIVAVNVAHLLLAHGLSRRREFAIRAALGASRGRQARHALTEALLLSVMGGAAGFLIAGFATSLLGTLLPAGLGTVFERLPNDLRVAGYAALLSLLAGAAFGAMPAVAVSRSDPREAMSAGDRSTSAAGLTRFGRALIVSEVSLALILVCGAGALLRDAANRREKNLGYQAEGLLTFFVSLASENYDVPESRPAFLDAALAVVAAVPGVERAGAVSDFPTAAGTSLASAAVEGKETPGAAPELVHSRLVAGELFAAMRLPILQGRALDERDTASSLPVVVVSRSFAARHFPAGDALGRRVRNLRRGPDAWLTIVGVCGDAEEFYADTQAAWYEAFAQQSSSGNARHAVFTARLSRPPEGVVPGVRRAIASVDPSLPVDRVEMADALYRSTLAGRESAGTLLGLFAAIGVAVAAVGVYASMAFAVGRRTREIAVRLAVGASPRRLLGQIVGGAARLVLLGIVLGTAGLALMRPLLSRVTEGNRIDPALVGAAGLLLGGIALLACLLPARRAVQMDPVEALRGN